jgi:preprotein translocase subunit SecF
MKLLRLAPENTKFGFMRFRRVSYPFSALMSIISVVLFLSVGVNFGIDFSGGTKIELRAKSGTSDIADVRSTLQKLALGDVEVQASGNASDLTLRFGVQ